MLERYKSWTHVRPAAGADKARYYILKACSFCTYLGALEWDQVL